MKLEFSETDYAIYQFSSTVELPLTVLESAFAVVKTAAEVLVVTANSIALEADRMKSGWCCFRVADELDFQLVGILAQLNRILAKAHISIFAISTYNTDYIFVDRQNVELAKACLLQAGDEIGRF